MTTPAPTAVPGPNVIVPGPNVTVPGPNVIVRGPNVIVPGPNVIVPCPNVILSLSKDAPKHRAAHGSSFDKLRMTLGCFTTTVGRLRMTLQRPTMSLVVGGAG
ncbi:MAG TPA: hypothetical protein VGC96_12565 [Candidatus Elarobacter sp.]|jgi:hypothetical protein